MSVEQEQPLPSLQQRGSTEGWPAANRGTGVGADVKRVRAGVHTYLYRLLPALMLLLFGLWWLLRPSRILTLLATPQSTATVVAILAAGGLLLFLPENALLRIRGITRRLLHTDRRAVGFLLLLTGALRLFHGDRLGWSQDQTGLLDAAQGLAVEGFWPFLAHYTNYAWLGHQHPPLAALYFGTAIRLFGPGPLTVAGAAFLITAGVMVSTYFVGKLLYNRWIGLSAAFLLLCIRSFLEHNVNMSNDMPLVLCFLLAVWGTLHLLRGVNSWKLLATGVAIGAGLLSKYTMFLFYPWLAAMALLTPSIWTPTGQVTRLGQWGIRSIRGSSLAHAALAGGIGLLFFAPWVFFTVQSGALSAHVETVAGYTGIEQTPDGSARVTLANEWHNDQRLRALIERWPASFGFYNLPLLGVGVLTFVRKRRREDWIVLIWIGGVMLPVFLLLPMWRYIMPALPALALLMARGLTEVPVTVRWRAAAVSLLCTTSLIYFNLYL